MKSLQVFITTQPCEGWVKGTGLLIDSYFSQDIGEVELDYSSIRPPGLPIKVHTYISHNSVLTL
jgi:hypothetical protein